MNPKTTDAAPAATAAPADAEPSNAELATLIAGAAAPAAKPAKKKPAAPAAENEADEVEGDGDPAGEDDFADDPDPTANEADETDPAAEEPAAGAEEATGEEEAPAGEAEEPPPEEPADAVPPPTDLDAEDQATRKSFNPAQQKRFDKALFKQREKARVQVESLQAELAEAKANPPAPIEPTEDNPLADVASEADLDKKLSQQRALNRWAIEHRDGGTIRGADGKDIEITAERRDQILADTTEMLRDHIPARREAIRQGAQLDRQAEQDYPWLRQKNTGGYVAVNSMLAKFGHMRLRDIPGIRGSLADLHIGQIIRAQAQQQKAAAKNKGPNGAPPKAPPTPGGHRPPPKVAAPIKKAATASRKLEDTGADPDNATLGSLISRNR